MFCEQCGTQIEKGKRFCQKCIIIKNFFPIFSILFSTVLFFLTFFGMRFRIIGLVFGILILSIGIVILIERRLIKITIVLVIAGFLLFTTFLPVGIVRIFAGYILFFGSIGLLLLGIILIIGKKFIA